MTLPKSFNTISEEFFQFDTMSASPNFNENQIPAVEENNSAAVINVQRPMILNDQPRNFFAHSTQPSSSPSSSSLSSSPQLLSAMNPMDVSVTTTPSTTTSVHPSSMCLMQSTSTAHENYTQNVNESGYAIETGAGSLNCFPLDSNTERIMPGIYLSQNFLIWNEEILKNFGFTHIIIIDKHIQELYYPLPIFQICAQSKTNISHDPYEDSTIYESSPSRKGQALSFGKNFEAIDLNFGEKSYLQTVLPNCYRAVRFIKKAFQSGNGKILVIDCNGGEQKCITIVVAYLMYKLNIPFKAAFARLKEHYKKADLDRFYTRQLYEYEPILQVQKAQSRGHSCSRDLQAAISKRKKLIDEKLDEDQTIYIDEDKGGICRELSSQGSINNKNNNYDFAKYMQALKNTNTNKTNATITTSMISEKLLHNSKMSDLELEFEGSDQSTNRLFEEFSCFPAFNGFSLLNQRQQFHKNNNNNATTTTTGTTPNDNNIKHNNSFETNNSIHNKKNINNNNKCNSTCNSGSTNINMSDSLNERWFNPQKKRIKNDVHDLRNHTLENNTDNNSGNDYLKSLIKNHSYYHGHQSNGNHHHQLQVTEAIQNPKDHLRSSLNFLNDCEMC